MFVEVLTRFCGNELVWLLFHEKIPLMKIIHVTLSFCPQNKPGLESTKEMYGGIFWRYLSYTDHLPRSNVF